MPLSDWNRFTQKIYKENKHKPGYKFRDALKEASSRKSEMASMVKSKPASKTRRAKKSRKAKKKQSRRSK
jgi:hypothetical protein